MPREPGNPYIFAGFRKGQHFNSYSDLKARIDARMPEGTPRWTWHDLRRTARSRLSEAGIMPHIAELTLGHALQEMLKIYDRHAYLEE